MRWFSLQFKSVAMIPRTGRTGGPTFLTSGQLPIPESIWRESIRSCQWSCLQERGLTTSIGVPGSGWSDQTSEAGNPKNIMWLVWHSILRRSISPHKAASRHKWSPEFMSKSPFFRNFVGMTAQLLQESVSELLEMGRAARVLKCAYFLHDRRGFGKWSCDQGLVVRFVVSSITDGSLALRPEQVPSFGWRLG
jgi:hypothetical protein